MFTASNGLTEIAVVLYALHAFHLYRIVIHRHA
jgi:hypothetical protein